MKLNKTRLSVALTPKLYNAIQHDSETYGISMASYCAFIVGQYYATKERMLDATQLQLNDIMVQIANDKKDIIE